MPAALAAYNAAQRIKTREQETVQGQDICLSPAVTPALDPVSPSIWISGREVFEESLGGVQEDTLGL